MPRPHSRTVLILVFLLRSCGVNGLRGGPMRGTSLMLQSWAGPEKQHRSTALGQLTRRGCPEWLRITWLMSSKISPTDCPVSESYYYPAHVWPLVYQFSSCSEGETLGCPYSESSSEWEWYPVWMFSLLIATVQLPCEDATPIYTLKPQEGPGHW